MKNAKTYPVQPTVKEYAADAWLVLRIVAVWLTIAVIIYRLP